MQKFTSADDVESIPLLVEEALQLKADPNQSKIGHHKTLGLVFFNPSLRTRLSTQKAAYSLGMNVIVMNVSQDGWKIEFEDGTIMDGEGQEHIKDAVKVISSYVHVLGVRTFPGLYNREEDYSEKVLRQFVEHSEVPVISLESATLHPLQSLADMVTIEEHHIKKPKVVLSWAPHPKILPQAVANSFLQWIKKTDAEIVMTCPEGYELAESFMEGIEITYHQQRAFEKADFIYAKNWSGYQQYGKQLPVKEDWTITEEKMALTNQGKFMHCLPIRRNVVATDGVIDQSIVYQQAKNRECAAQAVLKNILEHHG
ncbi:N-acetylornithine carbamoyltransferase [Fulvivirga sp. M361]|uniref:N-acetylornithine carbamoyltransferase n=1 Tax=Fulvivirga sp. M361 TaxID=2594266 RepID=UPI00117B342D|nr:N-acetylornithine carbamoyltransferase [Fulvivirga sp. M361]TRX62153.1 N-acetylornithine carbamoyltransferase [Fulvivirga sp. M361]